MRTKGTRKAKRAAKRPDLRRRISPEQHFVLCNGQPVKNVKELADIMEHIDEAVIAHHLSNGRNDFAAWVRDVFFDHTLSRQLAQESGKDGIRMAIYRHVTAKHFMRR